MPTSYYTGQCTSRFTFVMKEITIYLVDWARSLGILPKFLTWGTSVLVFDYTVFLMAYLKLSYQRPKYGFLYQKILRLLTTQSSDVSGDIRLGSSLLAYTGTYMLGHVYSDFAVLVSHPGIPANSLILQKPTQIPSSPILVSSSYCSHPQYSFYLTVS